MKKIILPLLLIYTSLNSQGIKIVSSAGVNYSSGNTGLFLSSLQGTIRKDSSNSDWVVSPYFCFSEANSGGIWTTKQKEAYVTGSYNLRKAKFNLYIFTDDEYSYQKKFNFKGSLGIGIGTNMIDNNSLHLGTSIGIMPEYYISYYNVYEKTIRLSGRIRFDTKGILKFSSITLIQPSIYSEPYIKFGNNISIRSTNSLMYPISKNLYIGFQILVSTFTLSSYLDQRIKPTDITSAFTISYSK